MAGSISFRGITMKELKKHLSLHEQVEKLAQRGLLISEREKVESALFNINYYRLSGYLHDFKQPKSDSYIDNLSWDILKSIYDFDRKFTRILMYALEDVEETLKTRLSYTITSQFPGDPLIYLKPTIYKAYEPYIRFLEHFYKSVENNKALPFVKHHIDNYDGFLPMWVAVDLFTMGNLHAVYDNLGTKYKKDIARSYNTGPVQLASWIENLTFTRNHLAHYMRIYNFNYGRTPAHCKHHPLACTPTGMVFDQICVMSFMYSDAAEWNGYVLLELERILDAYSDCVSLSCIGFPESWKEILSK